MKSDLSLASNYLLKVSNINSRARNETCSKLTIKTYFVHCSSVFVVRFEHAIARWESRRVEPKRIYSVPDLLGANLASIKSFMRINLVLKIFGKKIKNFYIIKKQQNSIQRLIKQWRKLYSKGSNPFSGGSFLIYISFVVLIKETWRNEILIDLLMMKSYYVCSILYLRLYRRPRLSYWE